AFLQKFGDHRIGAGWLQQLDPAFAHGDHGHLNLFMGYNFFTYHAEPEHFVELASLLERSNGDSEVIDHMGHDSSSWVPAASFRLLAFGFWLLAKTHFGRPRVSGSPR